MNYIYEIYFDTGGGMQFNINEVAYIEWAPIPDSELYRIYIQFMHVPSVVERPISAQNLSEFLEAHSEFHYAFDEYDANVQDIKEDNLL